MKVLSVTSEVAPLVKTGGLADVAGALPGALAAEGVDMRVMAPAYSGLAARLSRPRAHKAADRRFGPARLLEGKAAGLSLLLLDAPALYDRPEGGPYVGPDRQDWPDNARRFGALCHHAARVGAEGVGGWRPDVIHLHDWQAGLTPAFQRAAGRAAPPTVMTIHNMAYAGLFPADQVAALGLPPRLFTAEGIEFHGRLGFLKAGLALADRITTVSPGYARELLRDPGLGHGLDGLLRYRAGAFQGILNGIDTQVWNPATDPALPARYSAADPAGKAVCRDKLLAEFQLPPPTGPLFAVVSRMTRQKGLDLLLAALPRLLAEGAALVVLGAGDGWLEDGFAAVARAHPDRIAARIGYDEALAHRIQAGADALLVPSRFEPCGLTQLCALRYGTAPVVARVGGLADTVIDANPAALRAGAATGVVHAPDSVQALEDGIARTCALFRTPDAWARIAANAMAHPVGWQESAARYAALYRDLAPAAA